MTSRSREIASSMKNLIGVVKQLNINAAAMQEEISRFKLSD